MTADWRLIRRNDATRHKITTTANGNVSKPFDAFTYSLSLSLKALCKERSNLLLIVLSNQ
jgi:hypothetical protein